MKNALSIDLEDWYQGMLQISNTDWGSFEDRIEESLGVVLGMLKRYDTKATFFVLGYIAEKFPNAIKAISGNGHEVASHGFSHRPVYEQTKAQFKADIEHSKKAIEAVIGKKVLGYRAPFFSITKKTLWALDVLRDAGFKYDSSIFPTKNFLYGIPDAPHTIHMVADGGLTEYPLSVVKRMGFTMPVCGGFYMRALPYTMMKRGITAFNKEKGPAVVYFHPWELDTGKPRIRMPLKWKVIHEYNIKGMKKKIENLLRDFKFTTIEEVISNEQS